MLFVIGNMLFKQNKKYNINIFLIQLIFIVLYVLIQIYVGQFNIFLKIILIIIFFKIIFKENIIKIINYVAIIFVIQISLEFVIILLDATLFFYIPIIKMLSQYIIISNLIIDGLTFIFIYKFKDKIIKFVESTQIYTKKYIFCLLMVIVLVALIIITKNYVIDSLYVIHIAIEIILSIFLIGVLYTIVKQNKKIENITKQYTEATEYYKMTEGLLEEYRYILHENKNQLLIIKSMIKENNELDEYLNHLINSRRNLKYEWVCDLKNIPIQGLKGLVNYKITEMKKKKLNVEIYIDDAIGKIQIGNLTQDEYHELYSIIGIFLDNALEASNISKEKMVSIQCYKEKEIIHIMIANTYAGEINLDKINELGYSSKGKNRGIGLPLVNKIVKESSVYKNETELFDIFFVQHLYIKLPNNT